MNNKSINYKVIVPGGVAFIGTGIVFMAAINYSMGTVLLAAGITWVLIGLTFRYRSSSF